MGVFPSPTTQNWRWWSSSLLFNFMVPFQGFFSFLRSLLSKLPFAVSAIYFKKPIQKFTFILLVNCLSIRTANGKSEHDLFGGSGPEQSCYGWFYLHPQGAIESVVLGFCQSEKVESFAISGGQSVCSVFLDN